LPALAADLVSHRVNVIAAVNATVSAIAAKAATSTIPIVFAHGADPVALGLVASLNKPGGNVTGVTFLNNTLMPKLFQWLHELIPDPGVIAMLVNPTNATAETDTKDVSRAADTLGRKLVVVKASVEGDFDAVFAALVQQRVKALLIASDSFFDNRPKQIAGLAARHALPAISPRREFAEAGGLMGYGTNVPDAFRITGTYAGRILKGEKPADLPVQQSTKVELIINMKTAKALGLTVPNTLLARADEVIE
jgi:putative ABC transport system substrate-binding protein